MFNPLIVPGAAPFFFPAGPIGCLLIHGFTSMPEEMRQFGVELAQLGFTTVGMRLPGHATHPDDLARTRATDWLVAVEESLAILRGCTQQVVIIGQSLGGVLALVAAARYPVNGIVAIATPHYTPLSWARRAAYRLVQLVRPVVHKRGPQPHPHYGIRREADYPAYMAYPTRIIWQAQRLQQMMVRALPEVRIPVLLMHSRDDSMAPPSGMPQIYQQLGTNQKQMVWLDGFDHAVTMHPRRGEVVAEVATFLRHVAHAS